MPKKSSREWALHLAQHGVMALDLADKAGLSRAGGYFVLKQLYEEGVLDREKASGIGGPYIYTLKGAKQQSLDLGDERGSIRRTIRKGDKRRKIQDTARLAQAMEILFPDRGITEDLVAWMVWTKELLDG